VGQGEEAYLTVEEWRWRRGEKCIANEAGRWDGEEAGWVVLAGSCVAGEGPS